MLLNTSELAILSEAEMKGTQGAMSSYLFDPAGWRYLDVGLVSRLGTGAVRGCIMSSLCAQVGGGIFSKLTTT